MADTVRVDAAALRAAVGDDRYWRAAHPEHKAWRSWVTEGFRALYDGERAEGGVVHVRAYMRDGHMVSAHTRSAPPRQDVVERESALRPKAFAERALAILPGTTPFAMGTRRSLLESQNVIPVARRPDQERRIPSGEIPSLQDGMRGGYPGLGAGSRGGAPASGAGGQPQRPVIHQGRQGKHTPGHNNYQPNQSRSELGRDVNAQRLVDEFAGRGEMANKIPVGQPGSRERFDTGNRIIGIYRSHDGARSALTTRGHIHYGRDGQVHIVPARPRGWVE